MKRTVGRIALFFVAAVAGWGTSEWLRRSHFGQELIGRFVESETAVRFEANLREATRGEVVRAEAIDHELELLRDQFGDEQRFAQALRESNLSLGELRNEVTEHLQVRAWIEKQITAQLRVGDEESREYYRSNRARFAEPHRYRVSHLFLAAPQGAPPEVAAEKMGAIQGLSIRQLAGEKFPQLVTEASEDEASKIRGGDLGFFAATRMPPEFIAEVKKLRVGEVSAPVRSHLGFHIVQLTGAKPSRELSFDEVRAEVALAIANQKRALAVASLTDGLSSPEFATR